MPVIDRSQIPNAFQFVAAASARARQLLEGCTPKLDSDGKPVRLAEREVLSGLVPSTLPAVDRTP